jgi:acyl-CoA reductase-like NAD-dependent aldehyde dehydrogenase
MFRVREGSMTSTLTCDTDVLAEAVERCRKEQREWSSLSVRRRLQPIRALRQLLVEGCDDLCAAEREDLGKHPEEVIGGEILPVADACRFLQREAASLLRAQRIRRRSRPLWLWGQSDTVHRRPRGVVAIIGTWNFPLFLNGVQIIQALTAGNGVVWKPSEVAPASARALFRLLQRAGFPTCLVQLLPATREAGPALLEADIDHVVFTGSAAVGRRIATRLGERLISSTLELSGCDAMFVLPDADVKLAATAAWFGATVNRGQTCIAVRRAFVHRSLYPAFLETLQPWVSRAEPMRLALASQARQAERLVEDALRKGGRLLGAVRNTQGEAEFAPSVIADAREDMDLLREASFAPLLAISPVDDLEEALQLDALCPYGLGASVFTATPWLAEEIAPRVRTGMVTVNDVVVPTAHPVSPFGGVRDSGWGVTQGAEGLLEMTVPQVVSVKGGSFRPHLDMATTKPGGQEGLLRGLLRFSHGRGFLERWSGFWQMWRGSRQE